MLQFLARYNKFFVAIIMTFIYFLNSYFEVELPINEQDVTTLWMTLMSLLVYIVPNGKT